MTTETLPSYFPLLSHTLAHSFLNYDILQKQYAGPISIRNSSLITINNLSKNTGHEIHCSGDLGSILSYLLGVLPWVLWFPPTVP